MKKKPQDIRFEKEAKNLQKNLAKRKKQQEERDSLKKEKNSESNDN